MRIMAKKGKLFVLSSPSGGGKTTLCKRALKKLFRITKSVSFTTRPQRKNERNNRDYTFVTKKEFERERKKKGFLEWARTYGYYYGTPKRRVLKFLKRGIDVILVIDVKGAMKIKKTYEKTVLIFVLPPSLKDLENRLRNRKANDNIEIGIRMRVAKKELTYLPRYDYSILNDNLKKATDKLLAIIMAERCKISQPVSRIIRN